MTTSKYLQEGRKTTNQKMFPSEQQQITLILMNWRRELVEPMIQPLPAPVLPALKLIFCCLCRLWDNLHCSPDRGVGGRGLKMRKVAASCQMNKNAQATATRVQHLHRWGASWKSLHILAKTFHRHNWVYFLWKPLLSSKAPKCHPTCFSAWYKSPLLDNGKRISPGCVCVCVHACV